MGFAALVAVAVGCLAGAVALLLEVRRRRARGAVSPPATYQWTTVYESQNAKGGER